MSLTGKQSFSISLFLLPNKTKTSTNHLLMHVQTLECIGVLYKYKCYFNFLFNNNGD